ncbi:hypothetical protein SAMN04487912_104137 [Arthrobacter sp. cf158]|uniref:hypothetical protein n=1 Tax=Arthrobacter sp. cf158 TaxID=1761744 RepID=UPI000898CD55|nr:hypothetical protein [Arthrobacter sp. cf158]SDW70068.1 hypothetical protein SAMN04487912_104137 [Arthrobacter sp. cf158]
MTTVNVHREHATAFNEHRISRFAGTVMALATFAWAVLLSGAMGDLGQVPLPWQIAVHGLSLLSALTVYVYSRQLAHRTSAAGLMCFVAVGFFFADLALGFNYSPYFGIAVIAWAASARRPLLAGTGVLAVGAAIVARFHTSLDYLAVAGAGLIILAIALATRPNSPTD